jgi:hypothetical protein
VSDIVASFHILSFTVQRSQSSVDRAMQESVPECPSVFVLPDTLRLILRAILRATRLPERYVVLMHSFLFLVVTFYCSYYFVLK